MKTKDRTAGGSPGAPRRQALGELIRRIGQQCVNCPECRAECAFLEKYGTPRDIALHSDSSGNRWLTLAYECSLCGLCGEVCPVGLKPEEMFLEMRREAVDRKVAPLSGHKKLLAYERRGTSRRFSCYRLPQNCRTVFFPGCALPGSRPRQTMAVYEHLRKSEPALGVVLDCCCKPSHDLGRSAYFSATINEMKMFLTDHGVGRIITACPGCYNIFTSHGRPLEVATVYEVLLQNGLPESGKIDGGRVVSVHDSCVMRSNGDVQEAVRQLAIEKGFSTVDMTHSRHRTLCCGEGGCVGPVAPEFAAAWAERIREEAHSRILMTGCAGCADRLGRKTPAFHILDAVLEPRAVISGKVRAARSPLTYLNRLRVKRFLKKRVSAAVVRERTL